MKDEKIIQDVLKTSKRRPFFVGTNGPILNVQKTFILGRVPTGSAETDKPVSHIGKCPVLFKTKVGQILRIEEKSY